MVYFIVLLSPSIDIFVISVSVCHFPPLSIGAIALPSAFFDPGTGKINLIGIDCVGSEMRINECPHDPNRKLCFHFEDASVICQSKCEIRHIYDTCRDSPLRAQVTLLEDLFWLYVISNIIVTIL